MAGSIGTFPYGTNPIIVLTVTEDGVPTSPPANDVVVKLTDTNNNHYQPTLIPVSAGTYYFVLPGGAVISGAWTGRAYVPATDPIAMTSVDFSFTVDTTVNP
jgi:hypothetical protein